MATVSGLSLAGVAAFSMLFGATRRAVTRGDGRDPDKADAALRTTASPATRTPSDQR